MIGPITDAAWMDQAGRCLRAQQDGGSAGGPVATVSARVRKPWAAAGLSRTPATGWPDRTALRLSVPAAFRKPPCVHGLQGNSGVTRCPGGRERRRTLYRSEVRDNKLSSVARRTAARRLFTPSLA